MINRRATQARSRRAAQTRMHRAAHKCRRRDGVIDQTWMSSSEGPDDSPEGRRLHRKRRKRARRNSC